MAFDVDSFLDEPDDAFDIDAFLDEPVAAPEPSNLKTYGERLGHHAEAITGGLMQQGATSEDVALGAIARLAGEDPEEENIVQSAVKNSLAALNLVGSLGGYIPRKLMPWAFEGVDEKTKAIGEDLAERGIEGLKNKAYTFEENSLGYHAANIGESLALMVPTLALGATGAGATTSLSAMLPIVYGEQFAKSKDEGRDNAQAAMDANFNAITEMVTEIGPFNMAFKASQPALSRVLKTAGMEGLSEVINEGFQRAYDVGVVNNDTTTAEFLDLMTNDDAMRGYRDAAIAGAGIGAGMGTIGEVAQAFKDPIEVSDQIQSAETVDEALNSAQFLIDEVDVAQPPPAELPTTTPQVEGLMPEEVMPIDRGEARYQAEEKAETVKSLIDQYEDTQLKAKAEEFDLAVEQKIDQDIAKATEEGVKLEEEGKILERGRERVGSLREAREIREAKKQEEIAARQPEVKGQMAEKLQAAFEQKQVEEEAIQAPIDTKKFEAIKKAQDRVKKAKSVKPEDSLLEVVAKIGGINTDEAISQGFDKKDIAKVRAGLSRAFHKGASSDSIDGMRERVNEHGFTFEDSNEFLNAVVEEVAGNKQYTAQGVEAKLEAEAALREEEKTEVEPPPITEAEQFGAFDEYAQIVDEFTGDLYEPMNERNEPEYSEGWSKESRSLYELYNEASAVDSTKADEIYESSRDTKAVSAQLHKIIKEKPSGIRERVERDTGEGAKQPAPEAQTKTEAKEKDLLGKEKQRYYSAVSSGIFRERVSNAIQNDGQKFLDAIDIGDIAALDRLIKKYANDASRDQGGIGAGPGKVKQARAGAAQLWSLAVDAKGKLEAEATAIAEKKPAIAEKKPSPRKKHLAAITVNYEYNSDTLTGRASSKAVNDHVIELKTRIGELNNLVACLKG